MIRVFIAAVLVFLLTHLAASQDTACRDALNTLKANTARCTATAKNPRAMCSGHCGTYHENIFDSCSFEVLLKNTAIRVCVCVYIV